MDEKEAIVRRLKEFKESLSSERKVDRMIFFGSRASGKSGEWSDIDLIIVSPSFEGVKNGRGASLYKHWQLGYPVDFLCYTPEEFNRLRRRVSIVSEALKEGIAI